MPHAKKTDRISTGGYHPPRALYEPVEVEDTDEDSEEELMFEEDAAEDEEEEP